MYLWWCLCTLYLHAWQMRITVGDSGLCCSTCVTYFERWLTPLCVDSARALWGSFCFRFSANWQFFIGAQIVLGLQHTSNCTKCFFFNCHIAYAIANKRKIVWIETELIVYRCVAFAVLLSPKILENAESVGGQMRRDKDYPFSGVTSSGKIWRKVPESEA